MSQLRSVLEEVAAVDDYMLSVEDLDAADITELIHAGQMVEVLIAGKTRHLAERDGHHVLGYSSPTNLLCDVAGMSPWRACQVVSRRAVEYWRQTVDGPGELDTLKQQEHRGLSASWTMGGMLKVDGTLTTLAGEAFLAAVDANNPPRRDGDHRTPRQRRHDALENLCRDWLDNGTTPTVGGEKPHIILHTDLPALQGLAGGLNETDTGHIISIDTLRILACDCSITRIIFDPEGEVLDVGRKPECGPPPNAGPSSHETDTAKAKDVGHQPKTATSTMSNTGRPEEPPPWTQANSCAGPATPPNTPKTYQRRRRHKP